MILMLFWKELYFLPPWRQRVWGLKTGPKSWPTGWTFWVNCSLENLFLKISGLNPHLNKIKGFGEVLNLNHGCGLEDWKIYIRVEVSGGVINQSGTGATAGL